MKVLHLLKDRSLRFENIAIPQITNPHEVLIRMAYSSICGFDMMMINGTASAPVDGEIGHEGSGIIEAIGSAVTNLKPGMRVTICPYTSCGKCPACRSNHPEYCQNPASRSNYMSEYITAFDTQCFELPENVSLKEGCLTEPLMMAMHAVDKAHISEGQHVLIIGSGAMGEIILKLVKLHPVASVTVVEPDPEKRKRALQFGADKVEDATEDILAQLLMQTNGFGFDAVIEASGKRHCAEMALNLVTRGGSVVFFGLYGMDYNLPVNLFNLYWKDASISAVSVPSGKFPSAISMLPRLRLDEVVTLELPFEKALDGYRIKSDGHQAKVMFKFGGNDNADY